MKIIERDVARRTVIEAYVCYDCSKKHRLTPDFDAWTWSNADAIDEKIKADLLMRAEKNKPAPIIPTIFDSKNVVILRNMNGTLGAGGIETFKRHESMSEYEITNLRLSNSTREEQTALREWKKTLHPNLLAALEKLS